MRDEHLILRVGEDVPVVAKQESKKAGTLKIWYPIKSNQFMEVKFSPWGANEAQVSSVSPSSERTTLIA